MQVVHRGCIKYRLQPHLRVPCPLRMMGLALEIHLQLSCSATNNIHIDMPFVQCSQSLSLTPHMGSHISTIHTYIHRAYTQRYRHAPALPTPVLQNLFSFAIWLALAPLPDMRGNVLLNDCVTDKRLQRFRASTRSSEYICASPNKRRPNDGSADFLGSPQTCPHERLLWLLYHD